jgi:adenine deaminase
MVVIEELESVKISSVFQKGVLVAENGQALFSPTRRGTEGLHSMKVKPFSEESLMLSANSLNVSPLPIIQIVPGQILTRQRIEEPKVVNGSIVSDIDRDILKLVVVERHRASGNIGMGMVSGFGLKKGALASSVAHDSHNIIAVGADDESLLTAIREVERMGGGLVAADGVNILATLPLPIAGLLSDMPLEATVGNLARLERTAAQLGTKLDSPFSVLSFLALPVIPELRLTDLGLVDVNNFRLIR